MTHTHDLTRFLLLSIDANKSNRTQDSYCQDLLQLLFTHSLDLGLKQIACLTLKNELLAIYSSALDLHAVKGPSKETLFTIKRTLISLGLALKEKSLRSTVALLVARMAHHDYPEEWPTFFDELMLALGSSDLNTIDGAILVLCDFVRDDLSDLHFPVLAPRLMPTLYALYSSPSIPAEIKSGTIVVLSEFIEMIFMVKDEHPHVVDQYLKPLLDIWSQGFLSTISAPTKPETLAVKTEVLKMVGKLVRAFPKHSAPIVSDVLTGVWNDLQHLQSTYRDKFIVPDSEEADEEDEQEIELASLLYASLDFIQLVCRKKHIKQALSPNLSSLVGVLLSYLGITNSMEVAWNRDVNQLIQDDDEDSMSHSVRIAVDQLLVNLCDTFEAEFIKSLVGACLPLIQLGTVERAGGFKNWWKHHEVVLLALGRFPPQVHQAMVEAGLDFMSLVQIADQGIKCIALPLLQGRSLWFLSQFAGLTDIDLMSGYLASSIEALGSPSVPFVLKVFSLKAIDSFFKALGESVTAKVQGPLITYLCALGEHLKEDALILLLELLSIAVRVDENVTAAIEDILGPFLVKVWSENGQDVFIMELLQELVATLASNKAIVVPFQTRMFPLLLSTFDPLNRESQLAATALDLMANLVKQVPDPLPPVYASQAFPLVIRLLLQADDSALLQNGQELLKIFVARDFAGIIALEDAGRTGLDVLLEFIGKMLDPAGNESAAIFLGPLITKMIQKGGEAVTPYIPQLLTGILHRLATAKMPLFIETLVMIFCHVVQSNCSTVIEFLATTKVGDASGLALVLSSWCDAFSDLSGVYQVKLSTMAMMQVLSTADPRLNTIMVKGDLIVKPTKKIVTRSMSKSMPDEYRMVPFPVKAFSLIMDEYSATVASKGPGKKASLAEAVEHLDDLHHDEPSDSDEDHEPNDEFDDWEEFGSEFPEDEQDPICNVDLASCIADWVKGLAASRSADLVEIARYMSQERQDVLHRLVV
ncbi:hypothetical protein HDU91_005888 [Kappamyces sp. JEL0680]|nr:hypothetical protein HDU91_005888 [Kappamyces sp. JEL0680]